MNPEQKLQQYHQQPRHLILYWKDTGNKKKRSMLLLKELYLITSIQCNVSSEPTKAVNTEEYLSKL